MNAVRHAASVWRLGRASVLSRSRMYATQESHEDIRQRASALVDGVLEGRRIDVARTISLLESSRHSDRQVMEMTFSELLRRSAGEKSLRIGISGPPGVGKSTIIEALGSHILESEQEKLGVLAVDPSSTRTGGSILGDKTRMPDLSIHPRTFIRPSPSRGMLGGVARGTHASVRVLEAAGYNRVIIETVGVGQSEIEVEEMVDIFLLLLPPGGGDELQGIKKGVVEVADIIAITKADGDLEAAALRAKTEYKSATSLCRRKHPDWAPKVLVTSSKTKYGVDRLWNTILDHESQMRESGDFQRRREQQGLAWMWKMVEEALLEKVKRDPTVESSIPELTQQVRKGLMLPGDASDEILRRFFGTRES